MPDFSKHNGNGSNGNGKVPDKYQPKPPANQNERPPIPFEPRCHVCQSPHRTFIESLLIKGTISFSEMERTIPGANGEKIDRRSFANHAKHHMGIQEGAIRRILEEEAEKARQNYEEGVKGAITYRGILEVGIRKAYEDMLSGKVDVEPKDLINMIQTLQKMDEQSEAVAIDQLRAQASAFIQAIKEETDKETWERIANRASQIMSRANAGELPQTVDAQVVE